MQVAAFRATLKEFSSLSACLGNLEVDKQFRELDHLFHSLENSALVPAFLKKLAAVKKKSCDDESNFIVEFRSTLRYLASLLESSGSKASADFSILEELFSGCAQTSVYQLIIEVQSWGKLDKGQKALLGQQADPSSSKHTSNHQIVEGYASQLKQSIRDSAQFNKIMQNLKANIKKIKAEDLRKIAVLVVEYKLPSKRNKDQLLDDITNHQALNASQIARSSSQ